MRRAMEAEIFRQSDAGTPLGRLTLAGEIRNGRGVTPADPLRVYGSYAVMYLFDGSGVYRDANGLVRDLRAGDLVLVFPELGHTYGPREGERWSEIYLVFDGPVFDLWRQSGLLDPARPLYHREPVDEWHARLRALAEAPRPLTGVERLREVCRLTALLAEIVGDAEAQEAGAPPWLSRARQMLETDLGEPIDLEDVAAEVGLTYETFRKRFQQRMGVSPALYRTHRRIDAACELMRYTRMTNRQVAESLGFGDEFYFSKRFKQIKGVSPREFRAGG